MTTQKTSTKKKAPPKSAAAPAKAVVAPAGGARRVKLPDAMRAQGLDEPKIARKFNRMIGRLNKEDAKASTADKMLLEVLKECGKLLGAYPAARGAGADAIPVEMVHFVPRPVRAVNLAAIPPAAGDALRRRRLRRTRPPASIGTLWTSANPCPRAGLSILRRAAPRTTGPPYTFLPITTTAPSSSRMSWRRIRDAGRSLDERT